MRFEEIVIFIMTDFIRGKLQHDRATLKIGNESHNIHQIGSIIWQNTAVRICITT